MLTEAIVLAGGFGTRLKEVISDIPKPMAPVAGLPFLEYQFRYLAHYGIKKVILSTGFLASKIESHFGRNYQQLSLVYSHEANPMGTGGGIRLAMNYCNAENVLVLNGDSFFDIHLHAYYQQHKEACSSVSLAIRKIADASRYGTIELTEKNRISAFREKSQLAEPACINAGVYILQPAVYLQHTPANTAFSIEKDFFEKQLLKIPVYGFLQEGYFIDIGIPQDYNQAQHDFTTFKY